MSNLPASYRRLLVTKLSNNFREAVTLESVPTEPLLSSLKPTDVLIQVYHVGINASDINFTAGKYDPRHKPPFVAGLEALGKIVAAGEAVKHLKVGMAAAAMTYGAFSEYVVVPADQVVPLPSLKKELLGLLVTGLTSSLALEIPGRMTTGETVLVTAAAGGAGQIAVRLAKLAGNFVIGTCSSEEKVRALKEIGCDRVINYKTEDFGAVLKKEFPRGIDIIYESVGGDFLDTCMKNLAVRGRLIIIGSITNYKDNSASTNMSDSFSGKISTYELLVGSKTVAGFFLNNFRKESPKHLEKLITLFETGELKLFVDDKFTGLEGIYDAVDYLHAGKNVGKVVVSLSSSSNL